VVRNLGFEIRYQRTEIFPTLTDTQLLPTNSTMQE